jgi:predicted alpha/beta hydrolase
MTKVEMIIKEFAEANLVGNYYPSVSPHPKGSILIGCAMGITQKYYHHLAEFFCASGYHVLTFDFRGTGSSSPRRLKGYKVNLFDWAEDIRSALIFLKGANANMKLYFVGHSIASQLFGFVNNNNTVDKTIFLASSTGYWKDGAGMERWKNLFLLSSVMPVSNLIWGFTNAKFFGQGENYPKGPSLQWRRWCLHPHYFGVELTDTNNFFSQFRRTITSFYFTDDPIANERTAKKLLSFYNRATIHLVATKPADFQQTKIGHTGFLSRKFKTSFWQILIDTLAAD